LSLASGQGKGLPGREPCGDLIGSGSTRLQHGRGLARFSLILALATAGAGVLNFARAPNISRGPLRPRVSSDGSHRTGPGQSVILNRTELILPRPVGWHLRHWDLRGADLRAADWHSLELTDVDLAHSDLRGANLNGVEFWWCDLRGARLEGTDLRRAAYDPGTRWPTRFNPLARGARPAD
jgi:hypothetical protein